MKLENLKKATELQERVGLLMTMRDWQSEVMRRKAEVFFYTERGRVNFEIDWSEADALIERYAAEVDRDAYEIGVEL